jgi:hypothetical protein
MVKRLKKHGLKETDAGVTMKLKRGTFSRRSFSPALRRWNLGDSVGGDLALGSMPRLSQGMFALAGLAIFAIWLFGVLPFLYGPPPRFAESGSPPQAHTDQAAQQAATKPDGSMSAPFFIRIPKTVKEEAEEAADRREKSSTDRWLMIFTGAVALFTLLLVGATVLLYRAGEKQLLHARRSSAIQSRDMRESLSIAQEAAAAAAAANAIAREAYVTEHRPWLTVELSLVGDVNFQENGFVSTTVAVRVTNIGKTPASGVYFSAHMWTGVDIDRNPSPLIYCQGPPFSVEGEIQAYLEMLTRPNTHFAKFVLLPNEHITRNHGVLAAYDASTVTFDVFGCAVYNAPGIEGFRHTVAVNKVWCLPAEGEGVRIMANNRVGFEKESGGSAT